MKKFLYWVVCIVNLMFLVGCQEQESVAPEVVVPYAFQNELDKVLINNFLNEYNMAYDADFNVTFTEVNTQNNLPTMKAQNISNAIDIDTIKATFAGVAHDILFIKIQEGVREKPCAVDSVFVKYRGNYIQNVTTAEQKRINQFDQNESPSWFVLNNTIAGWQEVLINFKAGNFTGTNSVTYSNFGAGVMILPSAYGYYNRQVGLIPKYSPLIFDFKLMRVNHIDHDGDRINSVNEDLNGDGFFTNDDTDGDGIQNFLDIDDDGDGALTKNEIRKPIAEGGASAYYPFSPMLDDPNTAYNEAETFGVPSCSGDKTTSTRIRKHLDKNCQ